MSLKILEQALQLLKYGRASAKPVATIMRYKSNKRKKPTENLSVAEVLSTPEEIEARDKIGRRIMVIGQPEVGVISEIPEEMICNRRVRIFRPSKNAMQSGTNNLHHWQIEFDARERWENPLMGWSSTGDPLSNMQVNFGSEQEAIAYCEKYGFRWTVDGPVKPKKPRRKDYGKNFSFDKRTRVSTK